MLRASVQALFMLLPESVYRPETLSRDKLLNCSKCHTILGLTIDTRFMMVELPPDKPTTKKGVLQQHFTRWVGIGFDYAVWDPLSVEQQG